MSQLKAELNRTWPLPDALTQSDDERLTLPTPRGAISCLVKQIPRRHFLMTLNTCEVHLHLPIAVAEGTQAKLHYAGWLLRGPLVFRNRTLRQAQGERNETRTATSSITTLATRLCNNADLYQALTQVHFTRLSIIGCGDSVRVELALYGGSELRSGLPGLQRYIGLGAQQIQALRKSLQLISDVLLSTP